MDNLTKAIKVDKILFSQLSAGDLYSNPQNLPETNRVDDWKNQLPYTAPIDVVKWADSQNNDCYTSIDNRRLYSWQTHNPTQDITTRLRSLSSGIEDETERSYHPVVFVWEGEMDKVHGTYGLTFYSRQYGIAMWQRCARQSPTFPLGGQSVKPTLGPIIRTSPYYKVDRKQTTTHLSKDPAYDAFDAVIFYFYKVTHNIFLLNCPNCKVIVSCIM